MIVLRSAIHALQLQDAGERMLTLLPSSLETSRMRSLLDFVSIAWSGSSYFMRSAQHVDACTSLYRMQQDACELRSLLAPVITNTEQGGRLADEATLRAVIALDEQLELAIAVALEAALDSLPQAPNHLLVDLCKALAYQIELSEGVEVVEELRMCLEAMLYPPPSPEAAEDAAAAAAYAVDAATVLFKEQQEGSLTQRSSQLLVVLLTFLVEKEGS